jgi:hypothetical protein
MGSMNVPSERVWRSEHRFYQSSSGSASSVPMRLGSDVRLSSQRRYKPLARQRRKSKQPQLSRPRFSARSSFQQEEV